MRVKWYTYTLHLPARVCPGVLHSDRLKVRFPSALLADYFCVPEGLAVARLHHAVFLLLQ